MLALAKQKLISELTNIYSDVSNPKTHAQYANRECDSIHAFFIQALPMTTITTFAGGVSGYRTSGVVKGKGLGGIDKKSPGVGLDIARKKLENDLKNIYNHGDVPHPAAVQAQKVANALEAYIKSAIVRTKDATTVPMSAPSTSGPVQGKIKGIGGVKTDKPGIGYKAAKPKFKQNLTNIYSRIEKEISSAQKAQEISKAIHEFAIEGIVKTEGKFIAGAAVSSESGSGSYFPGSGTSLKATLS